MHYLLTHRGPLRLSLNQCGSFLRSRDGLDRPDQQRYLNPVTNTTTPADKRPMSASYPPLAALGHTGPSRRYAARVFDIAADDDQGRWHDIAASHDGVIFGRWRQRVIQAGMAVCRRSH